MISVVILTKNNQDKVNNLLISIDWVDEIVIVDSGSTDKTIEIAKKPSKVKVFRRGLDSFSSQKNFGMSKCSKDLILFLDSDEIVTKDLKDEILSLNQDKVKNRAWKIQREDIFMGRKLNYGETGKASFIRLVSKDSGKWRGKVHEEFVIKNGVKVVSLQAKIIHNHNITIENFLDRINFYSDLKANELKINGVKENFLKMFLWPMGKFIYNYILKLGFLDGLAGFCLAYLMSWHSFLVRVKLRQLWLEA